MNNMFTTDIRVWNRIVDSIWTLTLELVVEDGVVTGRRRVIVEAVNSVAFANRCLPPKRRS